MTFDNRLMFSFQWFKYLLIRRPLFELDLNMCYNFLKMVFTSVFDKFCISTVQVFMYHYVLCFGQPDFQYAQSSQE